MDLHQMRIFLEVVERGSFSRAAEALRVGQSTVSFHIKALEEELAVQLLDRRGRKVRPTTAGRLLRRYADRMVRLRDEVVASLRAEETGDGGRIVIAASTVPGEYLLPPCLSELRRTRPGVAVAVEVSDSRKAVVALLAEECDLALVGSPLRDRRITCVPFAEDAIVLCGPSPNPFAPRGRLSLAELAAVPFIRREEGSGTGAVATGLLGGRLGEGQEGTLRVGSSAAAKRCVLAGLGLTFISRLAVADELARGELATVAFPGTPKKRIFYIARLATVTPSPAVKALHKILLAKR